MKKLILFSLLISTVAFLCSSYAQVVVLDPGHGYYSDGSSDRSWMENYPNMAVANKTKTLLQDEGYTVYMTRTSNDYGDCPSVTQRRTMADNWGADRFLSIHCNAGGGTGTETYYCIKNTNNVEVDKDFARKVQQKMIDYGKWNDRTYLECLDRLDYHLGVLGGWATSCLNEIGFYDNPADFEKLNDNAWQDKFALAYLEAMKADLPISSPTSLSVSIASCPSNNATFKWNGSGTGWQIHVSTSSTFSTYYLKWVSGLSSYTGPNGFVHNSTGTALSSFAEGTKYYWRIYYVNGYTPTQNFTTNVCNEPVANIVIDDFEIDEGHFDNFPTFSGSTVGISSGSTLGRVTNESFGGVGSLQVVLVDDATSSSDWFVRLLSGMGSPTNNISIESKGTLTFWLKTATASEGATVQVWMDDADGLEASPAIEIENDGAWHQYTFDLEDYSGTTITTGNGVLDAESITLDAIVLSQSASSSNWAINIDDVEHNVTGSGTQLKRSTQDENILNEELSDMDPIDEAKKDFIIYPNPSSGTFTLEFDNQYLEGSHIEIYNMSGVKVFEEMVSYSGQTIHAHELPNGMYLLRFSTNELLRTLKLLIKK